jgi:hypothetical protein
VFPIDELRRPAPLEPGEQRPMVRADTRAVEKLLGESAA